MKLLEKLRARPDWEDDDASVRAAAVRDMEVDDETRQIVVEIARGDDDPAVRREALRRLDTIDDVLEIGCADQDPTVRATASEILLSHALDAESDEDIDKVLSRLSGKDVGLIARSATSERVSLAAVSKVTEGKGLGLVARAARHAEVAKAALARLTDPSDILDVVIKTDERAVALLAFERLSDRLDRDTLAVIAKRARQKGVARRARARLDQLEPKGGEPEPEAPVESHAAGDFPAATGTAPPDFVAERAAVDEQRERRQEALAARRRLCEQVDALLGADAGEGLVPLRAEWDALPTLDPDLGRSAALTAVGDRFREAVERCQRRAKQHETETRQAAERRAQAELAQMHGEQRAAARAQEEQQRQANLTGLEALCQAVEDLLTADSPPRQEAERQLRAARQALEDLQAKRPAARLPTRRAHEAIMRRLRRAQTALVGRVRELRAFDDWHRWANLGVQERLCAQLEALSQVPDDAELTARYQDVMRQWRQSAELPKGQGEELRRRFQTAHDAVYPRCEAYLATQALAREQNLERRRQLIEEAEQLAQSTDWLATAKRITLLQTEWKEIGPVPRSHQRETWSRFRDACNTFFTRRKADLGKRKEEWTQNLERKQALCGRVEALRDAPDPAAAIPEVKKAQAEWKGIGPVRRKQSDAVWQRFKAACDAVYARVREVERQAAAERVAAREALCTELTGLVPVDDAKAEAAGDIVQRVRDIQQRWRQAPDVPPSIRKSLTLQFEQAIAAVVAAHPRAFSGTELDPARRLRRLESLCQRAERLAAELEELEGRSDASPAEILATKLRDALARNTMGAREDETAKRRAALEELRRMQTEQRRLGELSGPEAEALADRFQQSCKRVLGAARGSRD